MHNALPTPSLVFIATAAPSVGRSLNSRGSLDPRILAWKASQSERLTRVILHQNLRTMPLKNPQQSACNTHPKNRINFAAIAAPSVERSLNRPDSCSPLYHPRMLNLRCNMPSGSAFQTVFALWSKGTGGFPPPAIQRPSCGRKAQRLRRTLFNICVFNSVGNCSYPLLRFATRCGMV